MGPKKTKKESNTQKKCSCSSEIVIMKDKIQEITVRHTTEVEKLNLVVSNTISKVDSLTEIVHEFLDVNNTKHRQQDKEYHLMKNNLSNLQKKFDKYSTPDLYIWGAAPLPTRTCDTQTFAVEGVSHLAVLDKGLASSHKKMVNETIPSKRKSDSLESGVKDVNDKIQKLSHADTNPSLKQMHWHPQQRNLNPYKYDGRKQKRRRKAKQNSFDFANNKLNPADVHPWGASPIHEQISSEYRRLGPFS